MFLTKLQTLELKKLKVKAKIGNSDKHLSLDLGTTTDASEDLPKQPKQPTNRSKFISELSESSVDLGSDFDQPKAGILSSQFKFL